jgi:hypothetical protein
MLTKFRRPLKNSQTKKKKNKKKKKKKNNNKGQVKRLGCPSQNLDYYSKHG